MHVALSEHGHRLVPPNLAAAAVAFHLPLARLSGISTPSYALDEPELHNKRSRVITRPFSTRPGPTAFLRSSAAHTQNA